MSDMEFTEADVKVIVKALDEAETPETQAQREAQAKADMEKRVLVGFDIPLTTSYT